MMLWLRTIVFRIVFYTGSVPIVLAVPVTSLFGQRAVIANAHVWAYFHRWAMRHILRIVPRVEGPVPQGQVLYAAKHQAMYETLELQLILGGPVMVIKRELMRIPVWGWATTRYGSIVVDRQASATALRRLIREGAAARDAGRSVLLYPEGTRVVPGTRPRLVAGFTGLYRALALPVVPIALDSGVLLPKTGVKRPGVVTFRFGEPIPPGLPRAEVEARLHAAINALEVG